METRYLRNWDYNAALIFEHLEKIVHDNGGVLVSDWAWQRERKKFLIVHQGLACKLKDKKDAILRLERFGRPVPAELRNEMERLQSIDPEPHETYYGEYRYIQFILDGYYYYYGVDSNPFFPFHFTKAAAPNNIVDRNTYGQEDPKKWWTDSFYSWYCNDADRKEAANLIFNMLINSEPGKKCNPARPSKFKPLTGEE